jgi:hypothetical protein
MLIITDQAYLIIDLRGRVILETEDPAIAELCESRLAAQENRPTALKDLRKNNNNNNNKEKNSND